MESKLGGSEPTTISRVAEPELPADLAQQVQALLQMSFPGWALMIKKLGRPTWPDGEVDLLGHLF